jgi:hypothetical protein
LDLQSRLYAASFYSLVTRILRNSDRRLLRHD